MDPPERSIYLNSYKHWSPWLGHHKTQYIVLNLSCYGFFLARTPYKPSKQASLPFWPYPLDSCYVLLITPR